jgi:DNA invertase Pin-like site-specific DNA recombinase
MNSEVQQKVTVDHLKRNAYLYIRQSTLRQVFEHSESTERQYALRQRALALGWKAEQIIVIDNDLGQSGATSANREGFRTLVTEVSMGRGGIVLGLEVSRLARNSSDWHRLLEICVITNTLILDEDGLYDPGHFNDRLLLGLKGTMSEAELHLMRARMRGGLLNKARRGDLRLRLPIGLAYDEADRVVLDPDQQVQQTFYLFFETFRRTGAAAAVVRSFGQQGLLFPHRPFAQCNGELLWRKLDLCQALHILHNPRYAGAFFFGRNRVRKTVEGGVSITPVPEDQWHTLLPGAHPGYISWDEYQRNQNILHENALAYGLNHHGSPPREGPALLQGLLICAVCGYRMTVHYRHWHNRLIPVYLCQRHTLVRGAEPSCQSIQGEPLDAAVGELLLEAVSPLSLEVALSVQEEIKRRIDEADRLRQARVERVRYEADLARRRYMRADPDNRLVVDSLEADWNTKLRALAEAQQEYDRQRQVDPTITDEQRSHIMALAADFPALWREPKTPQRERKRMIRLLIEDVTVSKDKVITAHVRFKGGASKMLTLPVPPKLFDIYKTNPEVIKEIDALLEDHTYKQIAEILNRRGFRPGRAAAFDSITVGSICITHRLKSRYARLHARGLMTLNEMAALLNVNPKTVIKWRQQDLLRGHRYDDVGQYLYERPEPQLVPKNKGLKLAARPKVVPPIHQEVQYEA